MRKNKKLILLGLTLAAGAIFASSCTANFCSNEEKARLIYAFDSGVSSFYSVEDAVTLVEDATHFKKTFEYNTNIIQYYEYNSETKQFGNSEIINSVISSCSDKGAYIPSINYFLKVDQDGLKTALDANGDFTSSKIYSTEELNKILSNYGYLKYYSDNDAWGNYNNELNKLRNDSNYGWENCPSIDFVNSYKSTLNTKIEQYRSCIATIPGQYGSYGSNKTSVFMDETTWSYAWDQGGHLIEGLIVFPVAWMLDKFANIFAGGDVSLYTNGIPQILSILVVTVIIRLFIFLVTIKSTLSQQKMTALQPELAKIQQKYPNANTNASQKQRLAEEQMRLYKKNGVNPLSSLLVMIVQFPVFIGVWGAMTGSAVLSTGSYMNLDLSQSIWECLKVGPANHQGWWTALGLIILMSAGQFFSMKVPQWIQKAKSKKVSRLAKNPAEKQQNRTANIVSYVMLAMIIYMGFTLPAAMGVYWFIGALVSLIQTLIMQLIAGKKQR